MTIAETDPTQPPSSRNRSASNHLALRKGRRFVTSNPKPPNVLGCAVDGKGKLLPAAKNPFSPCPMVKPSLLWQTQMPVPRFGFNMAGSAEMAARDWLKSRAVSRTCRAPSGAEGLNIRLDAEIASAQTQAHAHPHQ
jgi:hypothetical protein